LYIHWRSPQAHPDSYIVRISTPWAGSVGTRVGNGPGCAIRRTLANPRHQGVQPWEPPPSVGYPCFPWFPWRSLPSIPLQEDDCAWEYSSRAVRRPSSLPLPSIYPGRMIVRGNSFPWLPYHPGYWPGGSPTHIPSVCYM